MAHYAQVNEKDTVVRVLVIPDEYESDGHNYLANVLGLGGVWVQTSYNTHGGINVREGGTPLHKNYAGPGYTFDGIGFAPPKPFDSWKLNEDTYFWEAPIEPLNDGKRYIWDEPSLSWVEFTSN